MWCDKDDCPRREDVLDDGKPENRSHIFAGYEFFVKYHPECCPGVGDGSRCMEEHPEGWETSDPEGYAAAD